MKTNLVHFWGLLVVVVGIIGLNIYVLTYTPQHELDDVDTETILVERYSNFTATIKLMTPNNQVIDELHLDYEESDISLDDMEIAIVKAIAELKAAYYYPL